MVTIEQHNAIHEEAIKKYRLHSLDAILKDYRHTEQALEGGWRAITISDSVRNRRIQVLAYKETVKRIEFGQIVVEADLNQLGVKAGDVEMGSVPMSALADFDEMKRNLKALLEGKYRFEDGQKAVVISTNRGFAVEMQTKGMVPPLTRIELPQGASMDLQQIEPIEPFTRVDGTIAGPSFSDRFALKTMNDEKFIWVSFAITTAIALVLLAQKFL